MSTSIYARLPRNGRTARELAEKTGLSIRTAQRWTAEPREAYLDRAEQRRQQIRALREQGLSMRAIATKVGCSVGTVHNALNHQEDDKGSRSDHVEAS